MKSSFCFCVRFFFHLLPLRMVKRMITPTATTSVSTLMSVKMILSDGNMKNCVTLCFHPTLADNSSELLRLPSSSRLCDLAAFSTSCACCIPSVTDSKTMAASVFSAQSSFSETSESRPFDTTKPAWVKDTTLGPPIGVGSFVTGVWVSSG